MPVLHKEKQFSLGVDVGRFVQIPDNRFDFEADIRWHEQVSDANLRRTDPFFVLDATFFAKFMTSFLAVRVAIEIKMFVLVTNGKDFLLFVICETFGLNFDNAFVQRLFVCFGTIFYVHSSNVQKKSPLSENLWHRKVIGSSSHPLIIAQVV